MTPSLEFSRALACADLVLALAVGTIFWESSAQRMRADRVQEAAGSARARLVAGMTELRSNSDLRLERARRQARSLVDALSAKDAGSGPSAALGPDWDIEEKGVTSLESYDVVALQARRLRPSAADWDAILSDIRNAEARPGARVTSFSLHGGGGGAGLGAVTLGFTEIRLRSPKPEQVR